MGTLHWQQHRCLLAGTQEKLLLPPTSPVLACRQDCPTITLNPNQLAQELANCSKLLASAHKHSIQQLAAPAGTPADAAPVKPPAGLCKWFRPLGGLPSAIMLATAKKMGYTTVLASVFPWDDLIKWPYLNALYVWSKVYTGAIIMLNDG